MLTCPYRPDQATYAIQYGESFVATKLKGGLSRQRQDILHPSSFVTVQWQCNNERMETIQAFKRAYNRTGGEKFKIDLLLDSYNILPYYATIVPDTWKLASTSGHTYFVTCQLEVEYIDYDVGYIVMTNEPDDFVSGITYWRGVPKGGISVSAQVDNVGYIYTAVSDEHGRFSFPDKMKTSGVLKAVGTVDTGFDLFSIYGELKINLFDTSVIYKVINNSYPLFFVSKNENMNDIYIRYNNEEPTKDYTYSDSANSAYYAVYSNRSLANSGEFKLTITGANLPLFYLTTPALVPINVNHVMEVIKYSTHSYSLDRVFSNQPELRLVHNDVFINTVDVVTCNHLFENCVNLSSIPATMFHTFTNLISMRYVLKNTAITTLDETSLYPLTQLQDVTFAFAQTNIRELGWSTFLYNTQIYTFESCFYGCNKLQIVPSALTRYAINATNFSSMFQNCSGITTALMFTYNTKAINFNYLYDGCSLLNTVNPSCFAFCPDAVNFNGTFRGTSSLLKFPVGILRSQSKITSINYTFQNSGITTIDENFLRYMPDLVTATYLFHTCFNLTAIPVNIFSNNFKLEDVSYCFASCQYITMIPPALLANNTALKKATGLFSYNILGMCKITSIPSNLFVNNVLLEDISSCFYGWVNATAIPENLLFTNVNLKTVNYLFYGWQSLASIPVNIFKFNTKIQNFIFTFASCISLITIPNELFYYNTEAVSFGYCFGACTSLAIIPDYLFSNNTKVIGFYSTFGGCYNLISVATGLFNNCGLASNFNACFSNCPRLNTSLDNIFNLSTYPAITNVQTMFLECRSMLGSGNAFIAKLPNVVGVNNYKGALKNCTSLSDYAYLPFDWVYY